MDSTIVISRDNGEPDIWRWTDRSLKELWQTESNTVIGKALMIWMSARTSDSPDIFDPFPRFPVDDSRPDGFLPVVGIPEFENLYPPPIVDDLDFEEDGMFYVQTTAEHPGEFLVVTPRQQPVRISDIPNDLVRRAFVSDFTIRKGFARPCFEQIEHSADGNKQSYMRILLPISDSDYSVTRVYAVCRSLVGGANSIDVMAVTADAAS